MTQSTLFTLDQLRSIMRRCAGVDESVDLDGDVADATFAELGYDSLAVLEITAQIRQELGVAVPDGAIEELTTPRHIVTYVNDRPAAG